jgi:rhodanese-related sulfurtransferase
MKTVLKQAVSITALAALFGLVVNASLLIRCAKGEFREGFESPPEAPDIASVTLEEAEDHFANDRNAVFIDSRSPEQFASGHILGARNLSIQAADADKKLLLDRWRIGPETTLIVYCSGGQCLDSLKLALWLRQQGFREAKSFPGGWMEWSRAGLPAEVGRDEK